MGVLAVNCNEAAAELAQLARRGGPSVDARDAALAHLSLQRDRIEHGLDAGVIRSVPHLAGVGPRPEGQAQRVDDQRLAAAGLAGEQVQARAEAHGRLRDQGQVAHLELLQQLWSATGDPPQIRGIGGRSQGRGGATRSAS